MKITQYFIRYATAPFCAAMMVLLFAGTPALAANVRYADFVVPGSYTAPAGSTVTNVGDFNDPNDAIGQPSMNHTPTGPENTVELPGGQIDPILVSLGNGGSITLGFNQPVVNQSPSSANLWGYDMIVIGNAFQGGTIGPNRFTEPGFVEVAVADASEQPIEWFLILPRLFDSTGVTDMPPASLSNNPEQHIDDLFDGLIDTVPSNTSVLDTFVTSGEVDDLVLDDPTTFPVEGLGGVGIDIGRAVRQTSPGVAALDDQGQFDFVNLSEIDLLRMTDAIVNDQWPSATGFGYVSPEIDGVVVLPKFTPTPEPATLMLLAGGMCGLWRRALRRTGRPVRNPSHHG